MGDVIQYDMCNKQDCPIGVYGKVLDSLLIFSPLFIYRNMSIPVHMSHGDLLSFFIGPAQTFRRGHSTLILYDLHAEVPRFKPGISS